MILFFFVQHTGQNSHNGRANFMKSLAINLDLITLVGVMS